MKRIFFFISIAAILGITACTKNDQVTYSNAIAEFDATTWNANAAGVTYPLMVRVPIFGAATPTSSFTVHRSSGTIRLRVNMVGPKVSTERTVGFKLFDVPFASVAFPVTPSGQAPARAAATLTTAVAVPGTHYTALGNTITIPADSTWGYINLAILDAGATAGQARTIGISLDSTGSVKASPNYRSLAIAIDQR